MEFNKFLHDMKQWLVVFNNLVENNKQIEDTIQFKIEKKVFALQKNYKTELNAKNLMKLKNFEYSPLLYFMDAVMDKDNPAKYFNEILKKEQPMFASLSDLEKYDDLFNKYYDAVKQFNAEILPNAKNLQEVIFTVLEYVRVKGFYAHDYEYMDWLNKDNSQLNNYQLKLKESGLDACVLNKYLIIFSSQSPFMAELMGRGVCTAFAGMTTDILNIYFESHNMIEKAVAFDFEGHKLVAIDSMEKQIILDPTNYTGVLSNFTWDMIKSSGKIQPANTINFIVDEQRCNQLRKNVLSYVSKQLNFADVASKFDVTKSKNDLLNDVADYIKANLSNISRYSYYKGVTMPNRFELSVRAFYELTLNELNIDYALEFGKQPNDVTITFESDNKVYKVKPYELIDAHNNICNIVEYTDVRNLQNKEL